VVIARHLVGHLEERSRVPAEVASWCATVDRTVEEVAARMVLGALCGLLVSFLMIAVAVPSRGGLPIMVPVWVGGLLTLAGAVAPLLSLRAEANASRRAARAVVSSFLDLVTLCLAGGMGIEGALHASAGVAEDRLSARLRQALSSGRDRGETPWQALAGLGRQLRIDELTELSAAVALAGTEGARIRSTLSAKASSIRLHQLSEAEAEANAITERLFFPGMFLLFGFLVFVGYPAVSKILGGF
jgi:Flp pilus assembly protein TadB